MVFRNQLIAGGGHIVVLMKFAYGGFLEWGWFDLGVPPFWETSIYFH